MKAILAIPFLLAVALVVHSQGSFSGFTVWNALPVVLGFGVLMLGLRSRRAITVGCIAFAISATLLVALFHLAWLFDWGGTATGSSTSALAFIFVPIWACLFAGIIGVAAWGISRVVCRRRVTGEST
ncbi:MAG: hypothetical protein AB1714_07620 [Acidobacteriota bacterium]